MNVSITVRHCGETTTLRAEAGTPLAPLLREAGLLTLPCGVGKCGKCLILAATEPCAEERALLGDAALAPLLREAGLLTLPCGVGKCGKCLILAAT